jgi:hypothetical protein
MKTLDCIPVLRSLQLNATKDPFADDIDKYITADVKRWLGSPQTVGFSGNIPQKLIS